MVSITWLVLLVSSVAAMRQHEGGVLHEDVLEAVDDEVTEMLTLNVTDPPTPRLSPEDRARLQMKRASSMIQVKESCSSSSPKYVGTGVKLGAGAYATVYAVRQKTLFASVMKSRRKFFAMKVPHEGNVEIEMAAKHEMTVMSAAKKHHCEHVLPLVEKDPCFDGEKKINAIVTKLLRYDLRKYRKKHRVLKKCYPVVYDQIRSGLDCLHGAGWMHGDIKEENILFEAFDSDGCPTGIQLADFGLARRLGQAVKKFDEENYEPCWYLAGSMFRGVPDPLHLSINAKQFRADRKMDECSFALMMMKVFGFRDKRFQKDLGKGACGKMGAGRKYEIP